MLESSKNHSLRDFMIGFVIVIVTFFFYQIIYPYHLSYQGQNSLMLWAPSFFSKDLHSYAWLAQYIADFVMQFYALKWGGAFLLALLFLLLWILFKTIFFQLGFKNKAAGYALFPVIIEWCCHLQLNYTLTPVISLLFTSGGVLFYMLISKKKSQYIIGWLMLPIVFLLVGDKILFYLFSLAAYDYFKRKPFYWSWILGIIPCFFLFGLLSHLLILPIDIVSLYTSDRILMHLSTIVYIIVLIVAEISRYKCYDIKWLTHTFLFAGVFFLFSVFIFIEIKKENSLGLNVETYANNPQRVDFLVKKYRLKDKEAKYYQQLAWAQMDSLPDFLFQKKDPKLYFLDRPLSRDYECSDLEVPFFYNIGYANMALHDVLLGMQKTNHGCSYRYLKELVQINILKRDSLAASKYIKILKTTWFYKDWAEKKEAELERKDTIENNIETVYPLLPIAEPDISIILEVLLLQHPTNKITLNYLMCYYLLHRDLPSFLRLYDKHLKGRSEKISPVFRQALIIVLSQQKKRKREMKKLFKSYGVSLVWKDKYETFKDQYELAIKKGYEYPFTECDYWMYYHQNKEVL